MDRPYVEELRIQSYGCIEDATFKLTPLHALIGPNDSGKSTVLRALRTLSVLESPGNLALDPLLTALSANRRDATLSASTSSARLEATFTAKLEFKGDIRTHAPEISPSRSKFSGRIGTAAAGLIAEASLATALRSAPLFRLDPDFLRAARPLIPDGRPLRFDDERGSGLPALYDALIVRDLPAYTALNNELAQLFRSVKSIQLMNPNAGTKALGVRLHDGTLVPAELMSEGLLYYLAFAILPYLEPTGLLLIEEPENGLHPARIAEVMRVLRAISEKTQVLLATHSPLVINELQPDEVTVVTRSKAHGTKATLMKDTANFEERSKVYALGELWLSYANGEDEAPLLEGGRRP